MSIAQQMAKHLRDVHFGPNYTSVNLKDTLEGITWQQATTQVHSFNTVVTLVYHINYYISAVLKVLQGGPLDAHDKYSFDHPPVNSQEDWDNLLNKVWADAKTFTDLVEQLPDSILLQNFIDGKYGNYYRNLTGLLEHTYYHLGQITLIKKLLNEKGSE